jgi:hypothetical protein
MTTSLPASAPESVLGAAPGAAGNAALLGAFASAFTPLLAADGKTLTPTTGTMPDFAALLATNPPHAAGLTICAATASPAEIGAAATTPLVRPNVLLTEASVVAAPEPIVPAATATPGAEAGELPDRATLEAALAMVAPLTTALAPVAEPAPTVPDGAPGFPSTKEDSPAALTPESTMEGGATPTVRVTLHVPGREPVQVDLPATADPLPIETVADALLRPTAEAAPRGEFALPSSATKLPAAAQASVVLADGAELAVQVRAAVPARAGAMAENSAASWEAGAAPAAGEKTRSEKNFLSATEQSLTPSRAEAGIAVAKTPPAMPSATTAPIAPAHAAASVAALGEKMPAAHPQPELTHAAQSVAHRAVETVTNVVEAQAASRLQPVPSVQLRFKVGHEDLAVRVELRDGEVRTEFKTDSPELRSALAQEWRAVAARPESAMRFLEPVITGSNSAGQGSGSFSSHGQSSSQQQHAHQQFRAPAELFGSVGRSFVPVAAEPTPAVVTPLVLPTSQRLSAVA